MNRPFAVMLLAALAAVAGVIGIIDVLRFLGFLSIAQLGPVEFYGTSIIGAIMAAIVAAIWFWVMLMLWRLDPRGWIFGVVIAIVYLIFDFVAVLGGTTWQAMALSIIVNVVALILALLPGTKKAFGQ